MSGIFRTSFRTENLTVLLTDIKGFTERTASQSREESARWLARHEALLGPVVKLFGGIRRKDIGDAWLVTFASPTDAVRSAMAIQDRLWAYNSQVPSTQRIEVRAVLTLGELQVSNKELIGEAVTSALALEGFAEASEVVIAESVYLAMNRKEAPTEEIGLRQAPGLPEAVRLFRAARVTHAADGPPYGNRTLPPPPQLDIIDADWIDRNVKSSSEPTSGHGRRLTGEIEAVGQAVGKKLKDKLLESPGSGFPRRATLYACGGLLAVLLGSLTLLLIKCPLTLDPIGSIESLVNEARYTEAIEAIEELSQEGPERDADVHYLRGYLAWSKDRPVDAAAAYRGAISAEPGAYAGHRTIKKQMVKALEDDSCPVRRAAANTLALTGQKDVIPALEKALEAEASRSRGPLGLGRLRCDFRGAARRAIAALEQGDHEE